MKKQKPESSSGGKMTRMAVRYVVLSIVIAFALLVWPTPYHYEDVYLQPASPHPVLMRVNRATGRVDQMTQSGWTRRELKTEDPIPAPASDPSKPHSNTINVPCDFFNGAAVLPADFFEHCGDSSNSKAKVELLDCTPKAGAEGFAPDGCPYPTANQTTAVLLNCTPKADANGWIPSNCPAAIKKWADEHKKGGKR